MTIYINLYVVIYCYILSMYMINYIDISILFYMQQKMSCWDMSIYV